MKNVTWSHSALKDYEGCPRRYYEVKVLKNHPFTDTEARVTAAARADPLAVVTL